ncbi:MAG: MFS transporter [Chitinophagales bacterium]
MLIHFFIPAMKKHIAEIDPAAKRFDSLRNILNNPNQLAALGLMMLIMLGQFTIIPFIAPYMVSNVGFTENQLMYIYLLGGAATLITSPLIGRAADRYGKPLIFLVLALLSIIPLFLITHMPPVPVYWVLIVTTLFFIFISGRGIPATTMISGTVEPGNRGSFMSINSCVQQLSAAFASFLGGSIVTKDGAGKLINYPYVGYIAIAATLLAIVLSRRLKMVDGITVRPHTVADSDVREKF